MFRIELLGVLGIFISVTHSASASSRSNKKAKRAEKTRRFGLLPVMGLECFDFKKYTPGTILEEDDPQRKDIFADGDIVMRLNAKATETATLGVIHPFLPPVAYHDSQGVINNCLVTGNGAGLAILPKDKSKWNITDVKKSGKVRRRISRELTSITFTFRGTPEPITYFETTLGDLGDWNAFNADPTSATAHLKAYDSNNTVVDSFDFQPTYLGNPDYDACRPNSTLRVSVAGGGACDQGDLDACIHHVVLTFSSTQNGEISPIVFDPNFSFGQICYPGASVIDDPHFTGFDGSTFDFDGHSNHIFNLISDSAFQMNSKFIDGPDKKTYMGEIGIMVGATNKIFVAPGTVLLNDQLVQPGQFLLKNRDDIAVGVLLVTDKDEVSVHTDAFNIDILTERWNDGNLHLNFHSSVRSHFLTNPHGILGQTAQHLVRGVNPSPVHLSHRIKDAKGFLEGTASDYLVSDGIFGNQCTFNRFGSPQTTRSSTYAHGLHAIAKSSRGQSSRHNEAE